MPIRRYRRSVVVGLGLLLVAAAIATVLYLVRDSSSDLVTTRETSRGLVVAVRPNGTSFTTVDLEGNAHEYGPSDHFLPRDAVSGVSISKSGDVVVSTGSRVFVVKDADFTRPPIELGPLEFDHILGWANEVYAAPTQDGTAIWVVQSALRTRSGEGYDTRAYLVASNGSSLLGRVTDTRDLLPVGVTAGAKLVAYNHDDGEVLTITRTGEIDFVGSGRPIGVGRNHIALVQDTGDLVVVSDAGSQRVPMPVVGGKWSAVGYSQIPDVSVPVPTVTDDGRLLVDVVVAAPEEGDRRYRRFLYVVDVDNADSPIVVPTSSFYGSAAWTDNGNSIILMAPHRAWIVDPSGGQSAELLHEFDPEHFVITAS